MKELPNTDASVFPCEVHSPRGIMRRGQRDMAFANRGRMMNIMIVPTWQMEETDKRARGWGLG
jgi:hypothetical protein